MAENNLPPVGENQSVKIRAENLSEYNVDQLREALAAIGLSGIEIEEVTDSVDLKKEQRLVTLNQLKEYCMVKGEHPNVAIGAWRHLIINSSHTFYHFTELGGGEYFSDRYGRSGNIKEVLNFDSFIKQLVSNGVEVYSDFDDPGRLEAYYLENLKREPVAIFTRPNGILKHKELRGSDAIREARQREILNSYNLLVDNLAKICKECGGLGTQLPPGTAKFYELYLSEL